MASSMDGSSGDWRSQLQPEARQRIVNKILETLKRHLPINVPEGFNELRKIAIRFEEKIYTAATSQSDYLRKISLEMLSMEAKTQQSAPINPSIPNTSAVNQNIADPGSLGIQSQMNNPGQPLAVPNRKSGLPQNLPNSTSAAVQGSSSLPPALPPISGLSQSNITGVNQGSNMQNISGISQSSVNNPIGQGAQADFYANAQRQMQGSQQQQQLLSQQQQQLLSQQQQQHQQQQQSQNPLIYQHQLQQQLLNRKLHSSLLQRQQQQQHQQQEAASMASSMDGSSGDWRSQLQPEARQRIVNKILETLKRHKPINVPEGFNELRKVAIRFEEKIYTAATSQSDYLRKISLKMLSIETKTQQLAPINPSIPNTSAVNQNIADPGIQYELVTLSYPKPPTQWPHTPANRSVVDCDSNSILEDEPSAKQRKPNEPEKISTEEPSSCSEKQKEPTCSCPICMCEIVSPFTTLCGHIFCEVCIKTAIKKQKKLCPTCRRKLTGKNNIHRVFLPSLD